MKILIVAATHFEILPLLEELPKLYPAAENGVFKNKTHEIRVLITGVGMMHTAFALGNMLSQYRPDFAINLGIAGSFDSQLTIGQVVHVVAEALGDLGVEEKDGQFKDVFELGLLDMNQTPYINGRLYNTAVGEFEFMTSVRGLSINKVHGSAESIEKIVSKYQPDIESMEGAAFFFACLQAQLPFMEIRAISNYVEPRNKENWNIPLAIDNLNKVAAELLETLLS